MIIDRLENYKFYKLGAAWDKAFKFLISLAPDIAEGDYPLQGQEIFARVINYTTRKPDTAILESHLKYVDIQTVLMGKENIEWFSTDTLLATSPYDEVKDVKFYNRPHRGQACVCMEQGIFVALLPQDAHMPALMIDNNPQTVKKVVIKLNLKLLTQILP